jgi:hypothetical protein
MTRAPEAGVQGAISRGREQPGLHFRSLKNAGAAGTLVKSATATDTNGELPVRVRWFPEPRLTGRAPCDVRLAQDLRARNELPISSSNPAPAPRPRTAFLCVTLTDGVRGKH